MLFLILLQFLHQTAHAGSDEIVTSWYTKMTTATSPQEDLFDGTVTPVPVNEPEIVDIVVTFSQLGCAWYPISWLTSDPLPSTESCAEKYSKSGLFVEVRGAVGWCGGTEGNWEMELEDCEETTGTRLLDGQIMAPVSVYEVVEVEEIAEVNKKNKKNKNKKEKEKKKKDNKKKKNKNKKKRKKNETLCAAGSFSAHGGAGCLPCPENSYSKPGDKTCRLCPKGKVSPAQSTSRDACVLPKTPTCDCWTPECGYCTDLACTIKQDLAHSTRGLTVFSPPRTNKNSYNTVILYDEAGNQLGQLRWNTRGIFLTGCARCRTPYKLRTARIRGGIIEPWTFSLKDGVVSLSMGGEALYTNTFTGECLKRYGKTARFAFYGMKCHNSFLFYPEEMELGAKVGGECDGACPGGVAEIVQEIFEEDIEEPVEELS